MRRPKERSQKIDLYSNWRSVVDVLTILVPCHREVPEVKDLVKQHSVMIFAQWIKAHISHPCNERAQTLAKAAIECLQIDAEVKLTVCQAKRIILARVLFSVILPLLLNVTGQSTDEVLL